MNVGKRVVRILLVVATIINMVSFSVLGEENKIVNPGFEELGEGVKAEDALGKMPFGWTPFSELTEGKKIELTNEIVRNGAYSVKVTDPAITASVGLRSSFIPISKEAVCIAEVYAFLPLEGGCDRGALYLEFWEDENNRVKAYSTFIEKKGTWVQMSITQIAPSNAKYVTVLLYSFIPYEGVVYFDDANLTIY